MSVATGPQFFIQKAPFVNGEKPNVRLGSFSTNSM
jgi:hypothetical protein